MTRRGLLTAAGIIAIASIASKVLGFVREATLADRFGASFATDAYLAALIVPSVLFSVVVGAVGTTFIPVYTERARQDRQQALRMTNSLLNLSLLMSLVLGVVGYAFTPALVHLFVPGFSGPVLAVTVQLTRLMLPLMLLTAASTLITSFLQANQHFAAPALAGPAQNLIIIAAILLLSHRFGIAGVAVGTVLAAAAQILVQWAPLGRLGFQYQAVIALDDEALRRVGRLAVPVLLAGAVGQLGTVVDRMLASRLVEGSISALNYANKLFAFPLGIFVTALTTVLYPTLSAHAARRDGAAVLGVFRRGFNIISLMVMPMMTGLIVLAGPVVRAVYQRGAFDANATRLTSFAVIFFSVGMLASAARDLLSRVFFAQQDTTTPMLIGVISVALNILLNFALIGPLAQGGLALSLSLTAAFGAGAMLVALRRKLGPLGGREMAVTLLKAALASAVMAVAALLAQSLASRWFPGAGALRAATRLGSVIALGGVVYLGVLWPLRVPELEEAVRLVARLATRAVASAWRRLSLTFRH